MLKADLEWDHEAYSRVVEWGWNDLRRAVVFFWQQCVEVVNESADPVYVRRKRNTVGGKKGSQYTRYANPSKPGNPPHKRTGIGQASIKYEFDEEGKAARVGIEAVGKHMGFLELARDDNRRRPWLLVTLQSLWNRLAFIASGGV